MYAGLCLLGVAVPLAEKTNLKVGRLALSLILGIVFSAATIVGMEHRTISSTVPQLSEVPGIDVENARAFGAAGVSSVSELARRDPAELAHQTGMDEHTMHAAVQWAQLADLRGLGTRHAGALLDLGIETVCDLSSEDPDALFSRLDRGRRSVRPTAAEVRVWIWAAQGACTDS